VRDFLTAKVFAVSPAGDGGDRRAGPESGGLDRAPGARGVPRAGALAALALACASGTPVTPASQPPEPVCADGFDALNAFFIAWNDSSPSARSTALDRCCAPTARFVNPTGTIHGTAALATSIATFRARYPEATVEFWPPEQHHCTMRARWITVLEGGGQPVRGVDFIDLDAHGLFVRVVSFNDPPPRPAR
jgi:hypothetical protein